MTKKNLCGIEIEYAEDKEFHDGMFHCYGPHTVDGEKVAGDNQNFVTIESADGVCANIIAMCPHFEDAKAIVCAMGIAKKLMDAKELNIKDLIKGAKFKIGDKLSKDSYNIEAIEAKMKELVEAGKKPDEVLQYMTEHREDFLVKKPDTKLTNDSKECW